MKYVKHLACSFLVVLCCATIRANDKNNYYPDSTFVTLRAATEDEKQAIADAINKYLDVTGIRIADLDLSNTDDGGKEARGKVSFFGFDNIELKAAMTADRKIKSINTTFPDAATITPEKLVKFLSGRSLSSFLPKSFPLHTGISIKDIAIEFDNKGDSLSKVALNFGVGSYVIDGFDGFAIDGMTIGFVLDKPTSPDKKASATVSGDGKIGAMPINLSATMSSDPDDLLFSFTATGINLSSLLNSFLSENKANKLLRYIPESVKSKELSSITASFNPTNKNFSALAQTSFGEAELQFNGATAEDKSTMLFAFAPPAGFKFSSLSGTLAPMDGIDLSGTALIISTMADEDAECNLSALKDEEDIKVEQGVNIFSNIRFSPDLVKLLKINQLKLRGTCNETFTNMSLSAALDLSIPMGPNITMKELVFGTRLGTVNPIEFNIGGKIEAMIGKDLVGFNASFAFAPIDQKISGEFFMAALKKEGGPLSTGKLGADGKSDLPEWTNPFGIPGVGLRKLGVSAGLDFKNPILISSLGLTGAARLGTVSDRNKHIEGDATIVVDITKPTNSLIDITMKNMTILAMIEAFVDNANIQGQLRTMLNTGVDQGRVLVVPVDGMVAFGKTYNKGFSISGQLSLAGIKANGDFNMNEAGVSGAGSMDAINWGNGAFIISGRTTNRPQFQFAYTKGSVPSFFIDGKINLLGISSETTASLDASGFAFTTTGRIANAFEATLEGKGSFSESAKGIYVRASLRNDLVSQLNQMVTAKLDEAIKDTKSAFQKSRETLATAKSNVKRVDDAIAARTKILQGEKAAAAQTIRNENTRAMKEQQDLINTCIANNRSSQQKIDALPGWRFLEIAAYETAIVANNATIKGAQIAYAGYLKVVNTTADVVESFPNDALMLDLHTEKTFWQGALATANFGLDVAEGASVYTLEATKWVMDKALGGLFDIKTAEFSGTFGLNNQYKVNTAINFTLANNPYNMMMELDFNNLASSAAKIAQDIVKGNLIKAGYAKTFSAELNKPVSNIVLSSPAKLLPTDIASRPLEKAITTAPAMNIPVGPSNPAYWANKFFRIENLWQAGQRINTEKGLASTVMFDGAWSARWTFTQVPGTNFYWIQNRYTGGRLNIENGMLECTTIADNAWSAQWELKNIGDKLFWIENRWKAGQRIHVENGKLECSAIQDGANSAMWYIREATPENGEITFKFARFENISFGNARINIEKGPVVASTVPDNAWSAMWFVRPVLGATNYYWLENKWKPGRLHFDNGSITTRDVANESQSAQWLIVPVPGTNYFTLESRIRPGYRLNISFGQLVCTNVPVTERTALWNFNLVQ